MQMDPSSQQAPPIKHMMTVPEKIELTSTGAYPSPPRAGTAGQRQDGAGYRMMRVPDRIMLETGVGGEGESETGGVVGGYVHQSHGPPLEPPTAPNPTQNSTADRATLLSLERRLQAVENHVSHLQQAVLQQATRDGGRRRSDGSRVWYALTFAGWLMVPLVVVFMFHYRKTAL